MTQAPGDTLDGSAASGGEQPDTSPLASPRTRVIAHEAFDELWQPSYTTRDTQLLIGRSHAYRLLAEELGLPEDQVHLTVATEEVAQRIPEAVEAIRDRLARRSRAQIIRDWRERGREIKANKNRDFE